MRAPVSKPYHLEALNEKEKKPTSIVMLIK